MATPRSQGTQGEIGSAMTLPIIALATALVMLVFTLPLTTLTSTSAALGADAGQQAWILSAMPLGCAIGLLPGGALADDYGRKRVFNIGLLVMAITLATSMFAASADTLIILRIAHGIGGSAVMACGLGLIAHAFPDAKRKSMATSTWAIALGAGVAVGPILAAYIDAAFGWHAVYGLVAILALALAVAGAFCLRESKAEQPRALDLAGTLTLGAGMAAILASMTELRGAGLQPYVIGLFVAGAGLLAGFVRIELRRRQPMLDLALFRRPDFTGAILGAFFSGCGVLAIMSIVPTMLHRLYGIGPAVGAYFLLAWSATSAITPFAAGRALRWTTPGGLMIGGLIACGLGQLGTGFIAADTSALRILPGMVLAGAANGFLNAALGRQAIASVPPERAAMGSGANNTARYLGSAFGLTLGALLMTGQGDSTAAITSGWNMAVDAGAALSFVGAALIFGLERMKPRQTCATASQ